MYWRLPRASRNTVVGKIGTIPSLPEIARLRSLKLGYGSASARRKWRAAVSLSLALTPGNATRWPYEDATCWKIGNSDRHGPHQDAHLFTTTGRPRSAATWRSKALVEPPTTVLPWRYTAASGGGAPCSARCISAS